MNDKTNQTVLETSEFTARIEELQPSDGEESKSTTGKKLTEIITGTILFLFSIFIVYSSMGMGIMMRYGPGAGMFPMIVGTILGLLSLSMVIENANPKKADSGSKFTNKRGILASVKMMAGLVVYVVPLQTVGYLIMTFALVIYIMKVVENVKWSTTILTAVVVTLMLFLIFQVGLNTTLPKSPFGF